MNLRPVYLQLVHIRFQGLKDPDVCEANREDYYFYCRREVRTLTNADAPLDISSHRAEGVVVHVPVPGVGQIVRKSLGLVKSPPNPRRDSAQAV